MPRINGHSKGGEWTVSKQRLRWPIMDKFKEAAVEAGIPASDDFNRVTLVSATSM